MGSGERELQTDTDRLRVTVLGSGTSSGIPAIGCDCAVCTSTNPKNKRRRSGLRVEQGRTSILIDTPPDLRDAALEYNIRQVDGVLFTHEHADHIFGCDDLRPFNYLNGGKNIPAYGHPRAIEVLKQVFAYFDNPVQRGGGVPKVEFEAIQGPVRIGDIRAEPLVILHGKLEVYGYRIGRFAYLNDTNQIPEETLPRLEGLEVLLLDALRHRPHETHYTIEAAVEAAQRIAAKQTYFVHMTHDLDHDETNATLPPGIELAYDGLVIEIDIAD